MVPNYWSDDLVCGRYCGLLQSDILYCIISEPWLYSFISFTLCVFRYFMEALCPFSETRDEYWLAVMVNPLPSTVTGLKWLYKEILGNETWGSIYWQGHLCKGFPCPQKEIQRRKKDFIHWVLLYEDMNPKPTEPISELRGGVADNTAACKAEKQN